jgi:phage terminase large subunit GpA-like protein
MSFKIDYLGAEWLGAQVNVMADSVERVTPVAYNEQNRYLPAGVTPRPGYIRFDLFPYMRELIDCFDPFSDVREVNLKKGVQTGYTTLLESVLFYYIGHVKTAPVFYITADKELAKARVENNILPMLIESDMHHRIRSADVGNSRKTGQADGLLQWDGGGFMMYNGAQNAAKMRQASMPVLLKDEQDGWPVLVGKDGNPDKLTNDRASAYWATRKILRGSTPTAYPSLIDAAYKRGDQRVYRVLCRSCNAPQVLRMKHADTPGGFFWDMNEDGQLAIDSVRYCCSECGHAHYEHDKTKLFATEEGAHWHPTAVPLEHGVRSYHLPAFYSPFMFRPWYKNIVDFLEAFDLDANQMRDEGQYQVFRNNVLGEPHRPSASRISKTAVSAHRRAVYRMGEVPNAYAREFSGGPVLFVTCTVDVHKRFLAVAVIGWTIDQRNYVIEYRSLERENEDDDCAEPSSPVWGKLRDIVEGTTYTADDGQRYNIAITLVDANYATDTVCTFCADYASGVYPIYGREKTAKAQTIKEFAEFTNQQGLRGYRITVDHYKDRMGPVLRREWNEDQGEQKAYHFNAPIDLPDKAIYELTVETRQERDDGRGNVSYFWHRPGNARNELFDCLGYAHAAVEIFAWQICIRHFELETIEWGRFWEFAALEQNAGIFGRVTSTS